MGNKTAQRTRGDTDTQENQVCFGAGGHLYDETNPALQTFNFTEAKWP